MQKLGKLSPAPKSGKVLIISALWGKAGEHLDEAGTQLLALLIFEPSEGKPSDLSSSSSRSLQGCMLWAAALAP